jgi:SAM-dependent methyltransferase
MREREGVVHRWETVAQQDPYWGVLSHDEYVGSTLADPAVGDSAGEFWRTGEDHIAKVFREVRERLDPDFSPARALDFGCGVGRLLLPLSRRADALIGVDVSPTMLELARQHLQAEGVPDPRLVTDVKALTDARGTVDFVHSTLVFQHIRPKQGMEALALLLELLAPGGCGAIQFFLARRAPLIRRGLGIARQRYRAVNVLASLAQGKPTLAGLPYEMNAYSVPALLEAFAAAGIYEVVLLSDLRPDAVDATFLFRRKPVE